MTCWMPCPIWNNVSTSIHSSFPKHLSYVFIYLKYHIVLFSRHLKWYKLSLLLYTIVLIKKGRREAWRGRAGDKGRGKGRGKGEVREREKKKKSCGAGTHDTQDEESHTPPTEPARCPNFFFSEVSLGECFSCLTLLFSKNNIFWKF